MIMLSVLELNQFYSGTSGDDFKFMDGRSGYNLVMDIISLVCHNNNWLMDTWHSIIGDIRWY